MGSEIRTVELIGVASERVPAVLPKKDTKDIVIEKKLTGNLKDR